MKKRMLSLLLCLMCFVLTFMFSLGNIRVYAAGAGGNGSAMLSNNFSISVNGSSPVFTSEEEAVYNNNYLDGRDFSYTFHNSGGDLSQSITITVSNAYSHNGDNTYNDWLEAEYIVRLYYNENDELCVEYENREFGLPASIVTGSVAGLSVNTTIPALREAFSRTDNPYPDVFDVYLNVSAWQPTDWTYTDWIDLCLHDVHVPINDYYSPFDGWDEMNDFYDSLTLTTPFVSYLNFHDDVPEITSVTGDWYSFIYTNNENALDANGNPYWVMPAQVSPAFNEEGDIRGYFWPNWELEDDDPIPQRFARYFGEGMNEWAVGPANSNHEVKGPENFIYGVAANKVTTTAKNTDGLSITLADFINSRNRTYFNSLPGLSNRGTGYYTEEESWDWPSDFDYTGYWYDYAAALDCIVTINYADGVRYVVNMPFVSGMDDRSFHVVGDPVDIPVIEPDYTLIVPADQTIAFNETENRIGAVKITPGEGFPEDGRVLVNVTRQYNFTRTDGNAGVIPYVLAGCGQGEEFLAGTLMSISSFYCRPDDLPGAYLSIYILPDDWGETYEGVYQTSITFTSQYVAP